MQVDSKNHTHLKGYVPVTSEALNVTLIWIKNKFHRYRWTLSGAKKLHWHVNAVELFVFWLIYFRRSFALVFILDH